MKQPGRKQNQRSAYVPRHAASSRKIERHAVEISPSFKSTDPAAPVRSAEAPAEPELPVSAVSASPAAESSSPPSGPDTPSAPASEPSSFAAAPQQTENTAAAAPKEGSSEPEQAAGPGLDVPQSRKAKKKFGWNRRKKSKKNKHEKGAFLPGPDIPASGGAVRTLSDGSISPRFLFQVFIRNIRTLFIWGVICTLACMMFFSIQRSGTAGVVMSLNYEESVSGKTPNGTRFNSSEFLTQDYLQAILERVGLQNELTTQDLSEVLSVSPTNGKIVTADEDGYYITSSYNVSVSLPWTYQRLISATDLLNKACEVYQEKFADEYRVTADTFQLVTDYSNMDFEEMGSYFSMMVQRIRNYLDVRNSQNNSYVSDSGQSYTSIRKQLQNFETYTLAEFDSFIWNNGVSKDPNRRVDDLEELNRLLRWDEKGNREKSTALMDILEMYNNKMVSSVLVPTYDSSGAFYMSRTKVGIDDLALQANDLLSSAVDAQKSIATNQSKISALEGVTPLSDQTAAQTLAESLAQQLNDLVTSIQKLDSDCYAQRISSYLVFTDYENTFMERYGVKMSLLIAVLACILRYAVAVLFAESAAKQQRKQLLED